MQAMGARSPASPAAATVAAALLLLLLITSAHVAPSLQSRDRTFPAVPPQASSQYALDPYTRTSQYNGYNLPLVPLAPFGSQPLDQTHRRHHRFPRVSASRLLNKLKPQGGRRAADATGYLQQAAPFVATSHQEYDDYQSKNQPKHGRIGAIGSRFRSKFDDVSKRIAHPRANQRREQQEVPYQRPAYQAVSHPTSRQAFDQTRPLFQNANVHRQGMNQHVAGQPRRTLGEDNDLRRKAKCEGDKNNPVFKLRARPAPSSILGDAPSEETDRLKLIEPVSIPVSGHSNKPIQLTTTTPSPATTPLSFSQKFSVPTKPAQSFTAPLPASAASGGTSPPAPSETTTEAAPIDRAEPTTTPMGEEVEPELRAPPEFTASTAVPYVTIAPETTTESETERASEISPDLEENGRDTKRVETNTPEVSEDSADVQEVESSPIGKKQDPTPEPIGLSNSAQPDRASAQDSDTREPPVVMPLDETHVEDHPQANNHRPLATTESPQQEPTVRREDATTPIELAPPEVTTQTPMLSTESAPAIENLDTIDDPQPQSKEDKKEESESLPVESVTSPMPVSESTKSPSDAESPDIGGTSHIADQTRAPMIDPDDPPISVSKSRTEVESRDDQDESDEGPTELGGDQQATPAAATDSFATTISPDQQTTSDDSNEHSETSTISGEPETRGEQEVTDAPSSHEEIELDEGQERNDEASAPSATVGVDHSLLPSEASTVQHEKPLEDNKTGQVVPINDDDDKATPVDVESGEDQQQGPPASSGHAEMKSSQEKVPASQQTTTTPSPPGPTTEVPTSEPERDEMTTTMSTDAEIEDENIPDSAAEAGEKQDEETESVSEDDSVVHANPVTSPSVATMTTAEPSDTTEKPSIDSNLSQPKTSPSPIAGDNENGGTLAPEDINGDASSLDDDNETVDLVTEAQSEAEVDSVQPMIAETTERPEREVPRPPEATSAPSSAAALDRPPTFDRRQVDDDDDNDSEDETGNDEMQKETSSEPPPVGIDVTTEGARSISSDVAPAKPEVASSHESNPEVKGGDDEDEDVEGGGVTTESLDSSSTTEELSSEGPADDLANEREIEIVKPSATFKPDSDQIAATEHEPSSLDITTEATNPSTEEVGYELASVTKKPTGGEQAAMVDEKPESLEDSKPTSDERLESVTQTPSNEIESAVPPSETTHSDGLDSPAASDNDEPSASDTEHPSSIEEPRFATEKPANELAPDEQDESKPPVPSINDGKGELKSEVSGATEEEQSTTESVYVTIEPAGATTVPSKLDNDDAPEDSSEGVELSNEPGKSNHQQDDKSQLTPTSGDEPEVVDEMNGRESKQTGEGMGDDQEENQPERPKDEHEDSRANSNEEIEDEDDDDDGDLEVTDDRGQPVSPGDSVAPQSSQDEQDDEIGGVVKASINQSAPKEELTTDKRRPVKHAKKHKKKKPKSKSRAKTSHNDFKRLPKRRRTFYR